MIQLTKSTMHWIPIVASVVSNVPELHSVTLKEKTATFVFQQIKNNMVYSCSYALDWDLIVNQIGWQTPVLMTVEELIRTVANA